MILPLAELTALHGLSVSTVLHLGARLGEERDEYDRVGAREVTWVEADATVAAVLAETLDRPSHRVIRAVVSDVDGAEVEFYVASNQSSSSLLRMKLHREEHPGIVVTSTRRVTTTTVDTLCASNAITQPDLLVLDLQGAELLALRGATRTLARVAAIYSEVNTAELYEGCAKLDELDAFLDRFVRVETAMTPHRWGDALYVDARLLRPGTKPRDWFSPAKGSVHAIQRP